MAESWAHVRPSLGFNVVVAEIGLTDYWVTASAQRVGWTQTDPQHLLPYPIEQAQEGK